MFNHKRGIVLGLFENETKADEVVAKLKEWDGIDDDVKLNAISVIVLDDDGKLKMHKVGRRRGVLKGVAAGAVAVFLAGYIISPLILPAALGLVGATRKPLDLSEDRRKALSDALTSGQAAVGVLVNFDQALAVDAKLKELGGTTDTFELTPEIEAGATEIERNDVDA